MQLLSEYLWPKYASKHWLTQINAEYDGRAICQKDLPVTGISHESIFAITPANDRWDSWTLDTALQQTKSDFTVTAMAAMAEWRWMKLGHVTRWDGNLAYSRAGVGVLRQVNTMKDRSYPEDGKLPVHSAGKRRPQHNAEGCTPVKEPAACARLFQACSSASPTAFSPSCIHPLLWASQWHHSSCCSGSTPCHKSFVLGENCDRSWHFICLFLINSSSSIST